MSNNDLSAKFHDMARGILPSAQAQSALDLCWNVESLEDIAQVAEELASCE